MADRYQERPPVETPSDADVLAGRGNACNFHPGNEYFRALIRKHKRAYVPASKQQKARFSRIIVDEIYSRNGRFLKQDATTKLWHDIGDKKALDKTRQALREGAPDILKEIKPGSSDSDDEKLQPDPCSSMGKVGTNNVFAMAGAPPPPMLQTMHTPSSTPVIQNRSRIVNYGPMPPPAPFGSIPMQSLGALPPQLVANARRQTSQEMDALHRKLAALYTPDQFEPTPINPNLQLRMRENTQLESAKPTLENEILQSKLPTRPITRSDSSDSLDLKKIFTNEIEDHKKVFTNEIETQKPRDKMDELSQQLSNMSFSIGDIAAISEDGNLSGMFDESMRVRDNGNSKLKPSQPNNNKSMNMSIGLTDMSLSSFAGESQFAVDSRFLDSNVMSTTSISRVFDESVD